MKPEKIEGYLARMRDESERETRFQERSAYWQRWLDTMIAAEIEGGGDHEIEPADLIPEALAQHHDALDQEIAQFDAKMRQENGALRRQLIAREIAHAAERRQRVEQAGALRRRIGVLETRLGAEREARDAMRKEIAALAKELARDRAHRRLLDSRRTYAHASRVQLEKARRRTDQLIEEGGAFDA